MLALPELQRAFLRAVLTGEVGAPLAQFVVEDGLSSARRLQIYRHNAEANFLATLSAAYPVVERLGGTHWFAQAVRRFQAVRPSRCGDLQFAGEHFAEFLRRDLADSAYTYFSDVARLEWAYQEVLTAADAPVLDVRRLATVSSQDYGELVFVPHPALRTVASSVPILAIWRANQPGDPEAGALVNLDSGPGRVLLTRQADHVELRDCSPGLFVLAQAICAGQPLGIAADLAYEAAPDFDLAASLQQLVRLRAISDFRIGNCATVNVASATLEAS